MSPLDRGGAGPAVALLNATAPPMGAKEGG